MNQLIKKMKNKNKFPIYALTISITIFLIIVIRAATTEITWDESFTYITYVRNFTIKQFTNIETNLANNHIINTIMIVVLDKIFNLPYNEFIIRLPNIIMSLIYFCGCYMISKDEKHRYLLFSLLVLNYYVMDFFGLARGYGIAISFIIWMCYFYKKASKQNYDDKNIFISIIFGILACYANTSSIVPLFTICVCYLIQIINKKDLICFIKRNILKIIPIALLLLYIIAFHFATFSEGKPNKIGETTIIGFMQHNFSWMFIGENSIYNVVITIIGLIVIIISALKYHEEILKRPFFIQILVLIMTMIIPFKLFKKPFLTERALVPVWPLVALGIIEIYDLLINKVSIHIWETIITTCIIIILLFSFIKKIDIKTTIVYNDNYGVKEVAFRALYEQRTLTKQEYEDNKKFNALVFYREYILEKYKFDIKPVDVPYIGA